MAGSTRGGGGRGKGEDVAQGRERRIGGQRNGKGGVRLIGQNKVSRRKHGSKRFSTHRPS